MRVHWRSDQGGGGGGGGGGGFLSICRESSIKVVADDDDIIIEVFDDSPARQMVAEMMILAGEVAARYGQRHELAIPFRSQPQPELPAGRRTAVVTHGLGTRFGHSPLHDP